MPRRGKGSSSSSICKAAITEVSSRLSSGRHSLQPVAMSVATRVHRNRPYIAQLDSLYDYLNCSLKMHILDGLPKGSNTIWLEASWEPHSYQDHQVYATIRYNP